MKTADVIQFFGTAAAVARALGVSRAAVSAWGEFVPSTRWYEIEVKTGGVIKAPRAEVAA
jgi:hypothetical protein